MNSVVFRHVAAMAVAAGLSFSVGAQTLSKLNGTWVVDPQATEKYLIAMGPPPRNSEWLPATIARMCVLSITFDENNLIIDSPGPGGSERPSRLIPKQESKGKAVYELQAHNGKTSTVTVSFLNDQHITIGFGQLPLEEYAVWKRGYKPNRIRSEQDVRQAMEPCVAALKNVPYLKDK